VNLTIRRVGVLGAVMIAVALVGIYRTGGQDRPADVVRAKLSSGESIGDLLTSTKRSVVLVYSPEDCLACATVLGRWVQFGRDKDVGRTIGAHRRASRVHCQCPEEVSH